MKLLKAICEAWPLMLKSTHRERLAAAEHAARTQSWNEYANALTALRKQFRSDLAHLMRVAGIATKTIEAIRAKNGK